jgi:cyanophycinase
MDLPPRTPKQGEKPEEQGEELEGRRSSIPWSRLLHDAATLRRTPLVGFLPLLLVLLVLQGCLGPTVASAPGGTPAAEPATSASASTTDSREWSDAESTAPVVGPAQGTVIVAGGGILGPEIWERFVELAGGRDARIVVIPTAASEESFPENWPGILPFLDAGAESVRVLHTRDRAEADTHDFASLLKEATGVWFPGGRQGRLVDAYLNTLVHQELFHLLARGGVVGGTSAGASIQASYLVRGDPETNQILMAPGYEEGFGLLNGAAVDQHLLARGREEDLWELLHLQPHLLGIGVDEGTALVIRGDEAEVIGESKVFIYDARHPVRRPRALDPGSIFHLGERTEFSIQAPDEQSRSQP